MAAIEFDLWKSLGQCDVVWDTPSEGSAGSMPLGNGDLAANVWAEPNGDVCLYLSKSDAWSEVGRLLKLGRLRVRLSPCPFGPGATFRQALRLQTGEIEIGTAERVCLRVWVDAHRPVLCVEVNAAEPVSVEVRLEPWRTHARELQGDERHSAYGLHEGTEPIREGADLILAAQKDRIAWLHFNETSVWPESLRRQGLEHFISIGHDPLLHRGFGGLVHGDGLEAADDRTLRSHPPTRRCAVSVHALTAQAGSPSEWEAQIAAQAEAARAAHWDKMRDAHTDWWRAFWERSWIFASGTPDAETVTRGCTLQRFLTACAGRGAFPIKFNGSLFTADWGLPGRDYNADFRQWGGPYWFQNTRLVYWPMLAAGDGEMLRPLFQMYQDALPLAQERTQTYFGHHGAFFPETMNFWGTYADSDYGLDRTGLTDREAVSPYIRRYYSGALELLMLGLDWYAHGGDEAFLADTLLPLADAVLTFYDAHYGRGADGRLHVAPSQSLETWHDADDPAPDIAGLRAVLDGLLQLPSARIGEAPARLWRRLWDALPPLPVGTDDAGRPVLLPAARTVGASANSEDPELYAVFPYALYGVGRPDLDMARETFARRAHRGHEGWRQDEIWAACLGLADEAKSGLSARFSQSCPQARFPAFWGPNFDWVPDQDHGCAGMIALQRMLLQADGDRLHVLPAWPKDWDVRFRLHAARQTTVEGIFQGGRMERLSVTPNHRRADVSGADV